MPPRGTPVSPETRAKMKAAAQARWARQRGEQSANPQRSESQSAPLSDSEQPSSSPSVVALPGGAKPRMTASEATEVMERLMLKMEGQEEATTQTAQPSAKKPKRLPNDPEKRKRKLSLARLPARMPVMAMDELFRAMELRGLSKDEREEGIEAFAALFWYYGLTDPRMLALFWLFGVIAPRFVEWYESRRRQRNGMPATPKHVMPREGEAVQTQTAMVPA